MTGVEKIIMRYEECDSAVEKAETALSKAETDLEVAKRNLRDVKVELKSNIHHKAYIYKGKIYFSESNMDGVRVLPLINDVE